MKLITCHIKLSAYSTVRLNDVTPGEASILMRLHRANAGGNPILEPVAQGETQRTDAEELARLSRKYGRKAIEAAYPGVAPVLPTDFASIGVKVKPPTVAVVTDEEPITEAVPVKRGRKAKVEVEQTANPE